MKVAVIPDIYFVRGEAITTVLNNSVEVFIVSSPIEPTSSKGIEMMLDTDF